ncbi:ankyrin repeat domain-containing protein 10 [Gadus morhua]|uniref:ankyrin repeat domain-containing protein 10 n=1 Tax=Gadus morhua TaxID=8049 RepID=UPI0011B410B5|nr:ankyrin repeat domain-containing protein 10-like [Gadus morhua]
MISEMEIEEADELSSGFPLHCGCRDAELGALCALVHRTADPSDIGAQDPCCGWTPMHWAARFGKGPVDGGRKRLLDHWENMVNKKARTDTSQDDTRGLFSGFLRPPSCAGPPEVLLRPPDPLKTTAEPSNQKHCASFASSNQESPGETRHTSDMCGSLHRSGSPAPIAYDLGAVTFDLGDLLLYGHHHGYGDTAEDIGGRRGFDSLPRL